MTLEYEQPPRIPREGEGRVYRILMRCLIVYLIACSITLPFIGDWWIGEIPPLAIVHIPKAEATDFCKDYIVLPIIRAAGWSSGSPSPDMIKAQPWALALGHFLVPGFLILLAWRRMRFVKPYRREMVMLLVVVLIDFVITYILTNRRGGLSIY